MTPTRYTVTRDVAADEEINYSGRDVLKGETLYSVLRPTYGCVDVRLGIALTEKPDGDYPFFEFPLDAVEVR